MWGHIVSWPVVAIAGPAIILLGFGVLSMSPPRVNFAQTCFAVGYLIILTKLAWWVAFERTEPEWERAIFVGLIFMGAGVLWFGSNMFAVRTKPPVLKQPATATTETHNLIPPASASPPNSVPEELPPQLNQGTPVNVHKESQSFAFTEAISDTVTVLLDNGANIHIEVHLQSTSIQKQKSNGLLNLDGERPLTVYIHDGTFYVDALITDGSGHKVIQIKRNKLEVNPSGWDRNFSANAVEVVDSSQRPVFQMIRKRANLIQISGLFISSKGSVFDARPPKALFKYPAWKFPGEYAEQGLGESPDESPGNPYSPNELSKLTSAELLAQTQIICTKIRALSKEWNEGYFENNKKALQAMNAAKSEEEKRIYSNRRMADNEQLFRSLEARFNREYRRNARSLKDVLSLRVNRPMDAFKLPLVPPLLESGVAAGPDPFSDVADYLENLAKRMQ